jgi:hypothetical protein
MKKKIITIVLVSSICCALSACGGDTDTETSAVETEISTVESEAVSETDETETIENETQTQSESVTVPNTTTETESETVTETAIESEGETITETATKSKTKNNVADVKKTDTKTETTHTHSWDGGTVTQAATCAENGVITYKCSCGETKTETINATGHSWVAQTTTVHHDAEGMYQQVKTGTTKVVICDCYEKFYDTGSWQQHHNATHHGYTVTTEDTYEIQWVEISPAWDEPVTTGYICSVCGTAQ